MGYQFHCSHRREIFWISHGFPGARNDKTVVRYDNFLHALETQPQYKDYTYQVYTAPGQQQQMRGLASLCDGGYHKWLHTMCGVKYADEPGTQAWSGLCESVRKDVECLFGINKKRFGVLAGRFLNHDRKGIDRTVQCCAILHNMLLKESVLGKLGDEEEHWKTVDEQEAVNLGITLPSRDGFALGSQAREDEATEVHSGWHEKRETLIRHYNIALQQGEVARLRTGADILAA